MSRWSSCLGWTRDSPLAFFVYAIGVGVLYQILMALIVIFVRCSDHRGAQRVSCSLGHQSCHHRAARRQAPDWMATWGIGTSILSPVFAILVLATAAWVFSR